MIIIFIINLLLEKTNCNSGCEICSDYSEECSKCKENFKLDTNKDKYKCFCEDGFVLDEYSDPTQDRCIEAFPTSCPEGCNCDGKYNCISCQNNYITVYYDDLTTIKSCTKTIDCSQDNCQKCNDKGECLICKDGYIYSKLKSICILRDESIKCQERFCLQCSASNDRECDVCDIGYKTEINYNKVSCQMLTAKPLKIIYSELTDTDIITKNPYDVKINLHKIQDGKRRPYYYSLGENEREIYINNDDNIDFQIRIEGNIGGFSITNSEGSNKNPPYVIKIDGGTHTITYDSSNLSLEGYAVVKLQSEREILEVNKLTLSEKTMEIHHTKNIQINEVNIHGRNQYNHLKFYQTESNSDLDVSVNTFILHQNSLAKINRAINIDKLKAETYGELEAEEITVKNIEINVLRSFTEIGLSQPPVQGKIFGIPESIKVNIEDASPMFLEKIYTPYPVQIAKGTNREFIENCEKWAKVYNKNPTDHIYNDASCDIRDDYAMLELWHRDKGGKSKAGLIAGVVIAVIVVVGVVVFLLVYFLVIKKRKQNNESSAQQDVGQQNEEE